MRSVHTGGALWVHLNFFLDYCYSTDVTVYTMQLFKADSVAISSPSGELRYCVTEIIAGYCDDNDCSTLFTFPMKGRGMFVEMQAISKGS